MNNATPRINRQFISSGNMLDDDEKVVKKDSYKDMGRKKLLTYIAFGVVLVGAIVAAGYFYLQYSQLKPKVDNPALAIDEQTKVIKENVGKLILIDDSEEISVAGIRDVDKLKVENAEFYKNAKNGYFVLISSKRAIIYDKDRNLIINVAPIINDNSTPTPTQTAAPTPTPTKK